MTPTISRRLTRPRILLILSVLIALQATLLHGPTTALAAGNAQRSDGKVYRVWASPHANRAAATPLRGATLRSTKGFLLYAVPRKPVTRVAFWLDRGVHQRPTRVDRTAPYDLSGGTASGGTLWRPSPGAHVAHLRYFWRAGGSKTVTLTFSARRGVTSSSARRHRPRPTPTPTPKPSTTPAPVPTTPAPTPPPTTTPTTGPPVAAPAGKSWRLSWADEFNTTAVDSSRWTTCWDWTYGNCSKSATALGGVERYAPAQVHVAGGVASLVASPIASAAGDCYLGQCRYSSGLLTTARPGSPTPGYLYSFTYGYVEGRIKASADSGFWSTFWMLPRRTDLTTDYTHEIDILEMAGEKPTTALQTFHYAGRTKHWTPNWSPTENGACPSLAYGGSYHTYGVDWQPDHIAFYLDGKKCGQFTDAANIYGGPMQVILELMVNSSWNRSYGTPMTDFTRSSSMGVDYVRVYQAG